MAKAKITYICKECGVKSLQWRGKCTDCGAWDSLIESSEIKTKSKSKRTNNTVLLSDISPEDSTRIVCNMDEVDRVLGGGIVTGSAILLAGDPGIGKSTLMLQVANAIANSKRKILYLAGEESPSQIRIRAERLDISGNILISPAKNPDDVIQSIEEIKPDVVIIDSIQSLASENYSMGSTAMLRDAVSMIVPHIKERGTACFFIGHVTKDGTIAGPKTIEHLVDVVINFEGGKGHPYRLLRAKKNRFGPTDEVGVFTMVHKGLEEVKDPSGLFLAARPENASGSVVVPSLQGTRPLLVEVQALVSKSPLAYPRRTSLGVDSNRLALLTAVLEKTGGVVLHDQDVFINVAGGITLKEPAADLGIAAAIYSSHLLKPAPENMVFIGEIGLSGEVRTVQNLQSRIKEASKLGFKQVVLPKSSKITPKDIEAIYVNNIVDLMELLT